MNFRSLQFDCLRFWTTYILQIYARKTHADSMSVHKPYLKNIDVLKVSSFQTIKSGLITLYLICHAPHLRCQWFIGEGNFELRIMNFELVQGGLKVT